MSSGPGLPTGTITFFFSDVEGSTKLLQALGGRYDEVITDHNRLMRRVLSRFGGTEIGTEGDSFFVVFVQARAAVDAAAEAQRELAAYRFAEGARVRVRMGIHTGEGRLVAGNYRGIDVHRAARIAAAGHGGQVLVSDTTRALVEGLPEVQVRFGDLGEHRLKDLDKPEHLFQLAGEGLEESFPPVRTLEGHANNLPIMVSSFIGRESELAQLKERFAEARLVTLTGTGGTGKSRLAIRAGTDLLGSFPDGVFVVFLASVREPQLVASAVAQTLGLQRQGLDSAVESVTRFLATKRMLLILDNFEHLLAAAPVVADLLAATTRLKILVTSRAALRISGEQELPVPPLELPAQDSDLQELQRSEAVTLFVSRARAVQPDFELTPDNAGAVREICHRLEGLPLALELAAARIRTLDPHEVANRLNRSLDLLTSGSRDLPERQQTLRNTVGWSYELLDDTQRRLFAQLGVFRGGFSLEAAEAVCCADALDRLEGLVEQSLLKLRPGPHGGRYLMLEPIRDYALERLEESDGLEGTRRGHAEFYLAFVRESARQMQGPGQLDALERLEVENDNLRSALAWAIEARELGIAAQLGWGMWLFWWLHGYQQEGRGLMESLLGLNPPPADQALALAVAGNMALVQGDHAAAHDFLRRGVEVARQVQDPERLAVSLQSLGLVLLHRMDLSAATACFDEALGLFAAAGNHMMISGIHTHLGTAALLAGDLERAQSATEVALQSARRSGDPVSTYFALYNLAQVALARGDLSEAAPLLTEGLALASRIGNHGRVAYFLESLAMVVGAQGDVDRAVRLLGAVAALRSSGEYATLNYLAPVQELYEQTLGAMRAQLGEDGFEEVFGEGEQLTPAQAVAYALEGPARRQAGAIDDRAGGPVGAPAGEGVLVGRSLELRRLDSVLDGAERRHGRAVFVEGDPGVGKTRLIQELADRARRRGWQVAAGGGLEGGGAPAFWPWTQVLGALADAAAADQGRVGHRELIAQVEQLISGATLGRGGPEVPPPLDPAAARVRLFQQVATVLSGAAQEQPLLVLLEDLQWIDPASLQLLGFVGQVLRSAPIVVAGTYRPTEVDRRHPLIETLAELGRSQVAEHLVLEGLGEQEVGQLLAGMLGAPAPARVVGTIFERTGGNPLFVTELARSLHTEPGRELEIDAGHIPAAVRDILLGRLARLSEPAGAVLSLAAVAGRDFELRVVQEARGADYEPTMQLLEEAVVVGLIRELPESVGRFRFSHDLVRETILQSMTGARRALLHGKVGEALARVHGESVHAVELAHHFYEAADTVGAERAFPYAMAAAEEATACLAYEQAEQQLGKALDLVARMVPGDDRDRRELAVLLKISSLLTMSGGFGAAQTGDVLMRAETLGKQLGETKQMVAVLYGLCIFETVRARYDAAASLAAQTLQLAEHSGDPAELMVAHLGAGIVNLHLGRLEDGRTHLEQALAAHPDHRDEWLGAWFPLHPIAFTRSFVAWVDWLQGDQDQARDTAQQALELAVAVDDPFTICHCMAFDIWMAIWCEEIDYVAVQAAELQQVAGEKGFPLYVADAMCFSGWALARQGRTSDGAELIGQGIAALVATGAEMLQTIFLSFQAEAERLAGRSLDALAVVDKALKLAEVTGERFYEAELRRLRAELLVEVEPATGAAAERELRGAVEIARAQGAESLVERAETSLSGLRRAAEAH